MAGSLFENYVVSEILKKEMHQNTHAELYYYRSNDGLEADVIVDRKQVREWIEIKSSHTFLVRMAKPIEQLMQAQDKGFILYQGDKFPYKEAVSVVNYRDYLE